MAEDLAKAIVLASHQMDREEHPVRIATIWHVTWRSGHSKFEVRGLSAKYNRFFDCIESAINVIAMRGFRKCNEVEKNAWWDEIKQWSSSNESLDVIPTSTTAGSISRQAKLVMLFTAKVDMDSIKKSPPLSRHED